MKGRLKRLVVTSAVMMLMLFSVCTVQAKGVKSKPVQLAKKAVTVKEGYSTNITIKNIKAVNVKKITIKSNKKAVAKAAKVTKTKIKVTGIKTGNTNVTVTLRYKNGKKLATKKLVLKVKVVRDKNRVDFSKAAAIMTADKAKLVKGTDSGKSQLPIYDKQDKVITDIITDGGAEYKVPSIKTGRYDIYLEIGKVAYVGGESMFSVIINNKERYCIPQAIGHGTTKEMGRFVMAKNIELKTGDVIKVVGNAGFCKAIGRGVRSELPSIGNLGIYNAATKVGIGYKGGVIKNEVTDTADPLSGKTIAWLGSSVTYGYGSDGYSMADEIAANHKNTTCLKYAISGTTLVNESATSYVARMKKDINPNTKIDLFVVQLSTNDASTNKPLGVLGDGFDINSFDDKTVAGAIETIIAYVKATWNCPVVFYTGTEYYSPMYGEMVSAIQVIATKWNIGLIDLWNEPKMKKEIIGDALYAKYMKDGIHPTKDGYVKWWTPKFDAYLKSYLTNNLSK